MATPLGLSRPSALGLYRLSDRLSFLYLDVCRIEQDDNGTRASIETAQGRKSIYLPAAGLSCLLLGPGTTLTQPAAAALARTGCVAAFVGAGAVRAYSTFVPPYGASKLVARQARVFASPDERSRTAALMYRKRFGVTADSLPAGLTVEALRGMEGARMKEIYRSHARRAKLTSWRRRHEGDLDAVNEALNHANTALYGVVGSVVLALGLSPALGVIHQGTRSAFVLDIADLYKSDLTIPLAFQMKDSPDPGRDATYALREEFRLLRILPRIVEDIHEILGLDAGSEDDWQTESLSLWGPDEQVVSYWFQGGTRP